MLVVTGLVAVLFLVLVWKYWHRKWLRTLAGNTFVITSRAQIFASWSTENPAEQKWKMATPASGMMVQPIAVKTFEYKYVSFLPNAIPFPPLVTVGKRVVLGKLRAKMLKHLDYCFRTGKTEAF